jgi:fructose-1-phosphate kinase PfkB-like protein
VIRDLANSSARVCVHTSGEPLRSGAEAGPSIVKINRDEFEAVFAGPRNWQTAAAVLDRLHPKGLDLLIITDGPRGAYVFAPDTAPFRVLTSVDTWISTAGAGDTYMAALLLAIWDAAMRTCLESGAAISHHHGIGLARRPYLRQEIASTAVVLDRIKAALDPANIMNPGKLIFD